MDTNETGPRWAKEHYLQHFMVGPDGKMYFIPPAMSKDELLEQIRAVVREELQSANKTEPLIDEDSLEHKLQCQVEMGVITIPEMEARLKQMWKLVRDGLPVASSTKIVKCSAIEPYDLDAQGHLSLRAELEHDGKRYRGVFYWIKDVEQ